MEKINFVVLQDLHAHDYWDSKTVSKTDLKRQRRKYAEKLESCEYAKKKKMRQFCSRLVTDQTRFKSEAGHRIFVCEYVIYEHPQLYFKLTMQFRSAVFGFVNQL